MKELPSEFFPIIEASGTPPPEIPLTDTQREHLNNLDNWINDLSERMDDEWEQMHSVRLTPGGTLNLERDPLKN